MPDIREATIWLLKDSGYRYARFTREGVLQGAKSDGRSAEKKEWEDITDADITDSVQAAESPSCMRLYIEQVLDLDSL